ncbi:hypothetical protein C1H46_041211 [Malus baccata]|uniref:Uncharacterized protein n=1 Tax=Malus baccata TaxID=106549 RepID=A0A540KGA3_MALBA|nr:hypothetical protein C1H46_041211 [Malus baccata]
MVLERHRRLTVDGRRQRSRNPTFYRTKPIRDNIENPAWKLDDPIQIESYGAKKLGKLWLGFRVHANDDDQGNEAVVGDDLGLLQGPHAQLLEGLSHRALLRALGGLGRSLALALQRYSQSH